jgi:hypothetical protein
MATRSFKEYILGVAYAEIGFPSATNHYEYAKTQLVAAISYTLGRRSNYQHNKVFTMRSGSCDQNWCDIYLGCSRSDVGGYLRADGSILKATYPGSFKEASTDKTCFGSGSTGKNYWRCPLNCVGMQSFAKETILDLERINQLLVAINLLFVTTTTQSWPERVALSDLGAYLCKPSP